MTKLFVLLFLSTISIAQVPVGAWKSQEPTGSTSVMIVAANYLTIASYNLSSINNS